MYAAEGRLLALSGLKLLADLNFKQPDRPGEQHREMTNACEQECPSDD